MTRHTEENVGLTGFPNFAVLPAQMESCPQAHWSSVPCRAGEQTGKQALFRVTTYPTLFDRQRHAPHTWAVTTVESGRAHMCFSCRSWPSAAGIVPVSWLLLSHLQPNSEPRRLLQHGFATQNSFPSSLWGPPTQMKRLIGGDKLRDTTDSQPLQARQAPQSGRNRANQLVATEPPGEVVGGRQKFSSRRRR